ncbi:MAG: hypothetical protein HC836_45130 [Richelia sp. RM2_1_2]|nr:hypothetical protein [Richelia sp. RM2_1_2]
MMYFSKAEQLFKKARDKYKGYCLPGRLGQTRLVKVSDDCYGVKFHQTIVVKIYRNGMYEINNGGYSTPSTKERIQQYSPAQIVGLGFERWFVTDKNYSRVKEVTYNSSVFIGLDGKIKGSKDYSYYIDLCKERAREKSAQYRLRKRLEKETKIAETIPESETTLFKSVYTKETQTKLVKTAIGEY